MKQAEKIYMISDAAKQVKVEAHVLRYWEEELELPAKRNEMGHRYYTEEDIAQFCRVKELKEQGMQLKGIRNLLKNGSLIERGKLDDKNEIEKRHVVMVKKGEFLPVSDKNLPVREESREQKNYRLQQLLRDMIADVVNANNQELFKDMKDSLLKELDYQFRLQEEREDVREKERIGREEEHYKQVDELLRAHNQKKKTIFKKGITEKKRSIV